MTTVEEKKSEDEAKETKVGDRELSHIFGVYEGIIRLAKI
jgi:hypothetical protein